jgi:predicted ATP-dependent endonuclease of OLD family
MAKKNEKDGLRFTHLEVENFKSIEKKVIEIDGKSLLITGKNNVGKSSLIQALLSGIDPKIQPTETIKAGETKASTKVKIAGILNGQEEEYQIEMYYTPKNQKGRIVVLNTKGEQVKSPKAVLDSIIGNVTFDIFKFLNDPKSKQIKVLKELSGVAKDIDILDLQRKTIFDERTFLKRKIEEDETLMNNHGFTEEEIDTYSTPINVDPINEELASISKKITNYNNVKTQTADYKKKADDLEETNQKKRDRIAEIEKEKQDLEAAIKLNDSDIEQHWANYKKGTTWLETRTEPSAEEISNRLTAASLHNDKHAKINEFSEKQRTLIANKTKLQKQDDDIKAIDDKKVNLIKKSKLPIKGLTFTDDDIFLNGLPMEEGQINTQQLIDIGFEISMALNPNLRVVFLHEGSLFDQESLNALIKKCEERGYQLIAEIVTDSTEAQITFVESEA